VLATASALSIKGQRPLSDRIDTSARGKTSRCRSAKSNIRRFRFHAEQPELADLGHAHNREEALGEASLCVELRGRPSWSSPFDRAGPKARARIFALWYMRTRYLNLEADEVQLNSAFGSAFTKADEEKLEMDNYL
jgi:hypothetical protein